MDKAIKITQKNTSAIEAALRDVNRNAHAHTFNSYEQIAELADRAEANLLGLICKKYAAGAKFTATSGEKVASNYRSQSTGTMVSMERRSSGWFLVTAKAVALFQEGGNFGQISLTEQQTELAVERFKKRFATIKAD